MLVIQRGRKYFLKMHVPQRYASVEERKQIWISLKTDSLSEANMRAHFAFNEQMHLWDTMMAGQAESALERYDAAKALTRALGFRYMPSIRVAQLPVADIVERLDAASDRKGKLNVIKANALLGVVQRPKMTLSECLEDYWALAEDKTHGMAPDQERRARLPRINAFRNFIEVVGDIPIEEISPDDWIDFRTHWWSRIKSCRGGLPSGQLRSFAGWSQGFETAK